MFLLLVAYALLLVYGSLYPFAWGTPPPSLLAFLATPWPGHLDKGDVVQNLLVYMPFGLLVVAARGRQSFAVGLALAAFAGTAISFGVETIQQYLPARVPSLVDVAMNLAGSVIGALLGALVRRDTPAGAGLLRWRDGWFHHGPLVNTGLIVIGLWFLSQTSPLVPSLDIAQLRHALGNLYRAAIDPSAFSSGKLVVLLCYQAGLGVLLCALLQPGRPLLRLYGALAAAVCGAKLLVAGRVLSPELLAAAVLAMPLLLALRAWPPRALAGTGIALLAAGLTLYELMPSSAAPYAYGFNWVPFEGQMNGLNGFENILEFLWPTMAMACLARLAVPFHRQDACAVVGGMAVVLWVFVLEWLQLSIPGRFGDITQVTLAGLGWIVPWCVPLHSAKGWGQTRRV
ncbi:VanZ family protein [Pseudoduganella chitinolytica]|uniref:VanZ family protein n=1 Tax=Pseudoduganella chitinolytica TaxID=34070 RepID=A0ABY8BBS4_9BURK|nr:VanZ family protein [Pseudoduganella chitinolytica]WEF31809.1 VanZ family protein [Pseudoduganella chitinolytica]